MLRFLGAFGPCNDQTSWVLYDWISSGTLRSVGEFNNLGTRGSLLREPVLKGPHSAILGEATLGTCWGIAFYRSEAGHYRVPELHAAFCRKPLSGLEGAGVDENPSARLCCFPRLEKQDIIRVGQDRRSLGPDPARDPQGLTCFWDERPCWRVPPSFAGFCLFLWSRDRGRDSFHAPVLSVRGPLSPVDEGFQHFHETCSHIHPLERPGSEVSCLANCLHPASARRRLLQIRQMYPLRRSSWSTRAPLVYPRDHWLISDKVLGDLVYVRRGTRVLQGPGLASRCNFEGLRRRPCGAVDIGTLGIPWVLGMIQGPPSLE
ncbi:hypothetical protein F2Q68_00034348 [Brassica cretica]|uniref:Uncharacterized protein n=1 Tax=Brassica cretica TaxID=69181 RepID=A0A8S9HBE6_BRACR|nr:hypothetical protein F2Q68_00034348 [Brassica cretica]